MTVSTTTARISYVGNGVTVSFPVPFPFINENGLRVVRTIIASGVETVLVLNTDYTVLIDPDGSAGDVVTVVAPTAAQRLSIIRDVSATQEADFVANDPFPAETFETALDKLTMLIQDVQSGNIDRVPRLYDSDIDGSGRYDSNGNRYANAADAVSPSDLPTLSQVTALIGTGDGAFIQAGAGAVLRTSQNKMRDIVSVKDFGAVGDGVTNDDAAFALAEAAADSIYVPAGSYVLTAAPTLGVFWGEGTILVGGLTAYLHPTPGPVNEIFAEVFAPDPTGVADSAPALQRAIDFAQNNNLPLVLGAAASYRLNTGLTFKHGSNGSDPFRYAVKVVGNYATLNPQGGVRAITVVPRCLLADIATGRGDAPIYMRDLIIEGAANPATARAITVGLAGYVTSAFEVMDFTNIVVNGFTGTGVSVFVETKHALFTRWVQRAGSFEIRCSTSGGFCGDFMFEWCEWGGGTVAVPPLLMESSAGEVRGIKFVGGAIYGSGTKLSATGTGAVGDIWMSGGVQFDGPDAPVNEQAMIVSATDTARVFQVHLTDVYFVSYAGACITASSTGSGTIYQFKIEGAGVGSCAVSASVGNSMFSMAGVESISIRGVEFDSVTAAAPGGLMNFDGCTNVAVQGNKATRCSTVEYMVIIGNGDTHIITDNMANVGVGVVNDYTGGAPTRLVTDNLLV